MANLSINEKTLKSLYKAKEHLKESYTNIEELLSDCYENPETLELNHKRLKKINYAKYKTDTAFFIFKEIFDVFHEMDILKEMNNQEKMNQHIKDIEES